MMMKMRMNWKTTQATDEKYVYLTVMRDIKLFCASGYCEVEVCFYHFLILPKGFIKRNMTDIAPMYLKKHLFIDWRDKDAVRAFYLRFITMLCKLNSLQFDLKAFDEAFSVFIQYIKALK